jgi:hypothetical protein
MVDRDLPARTSNLTSALRFGRRTTRLPVEQEVHTTTGHSL